MRNRPSTIRERIDYFRSVLSNMTESIVNVDAFEIHENDQVTFQMHLSVMQRTVLKSAGVFVLEVFGKFCKCYFMKNLNCHSLLAIQNQTDKDTIH